MIREPTEYKYWAFISYSSKDKKWAKWIHRAIEGYGIPAQFVNHPTPAGHPVPKRLKPCFRDRDELAAAPELGKEIEDRLWKSRYLIVVCSPRAAQSKWVNKEIETFQKFGREDRVLAVIVDGERHGGGARECYPVAIRTQDPIAPDVRREFDGKTNAKLKLLASILGVDFDALKQRDNLRRLRKLELIIALTLLLASGFAALAWYANGQKINARRAEADAITQRDDAVKARYAEAAAKAEAVKRESEAVEQRQIAVQRGRETEEALKRTRRTLSQLDLEKALALSQPGQGADALMYLDRALRYDPANQTALQNVGGLLLNRNWPLPLWRYVSGTNRVAGAFYLPNGKEVAVWDQGGRVDFLDVLTGRPTREALQVDPDADPLGPSSSGHRLLARAISGGLLLLDAAKGSVIKRVDEGGGDHRYSDCQMSEDRRRVAVKKAGHIRVYDTEKLELLLDVESPTVNIREEVAFDPSGNRIVLALEKSLEVWDYGMNPPQHRILEDTGQTIGNVAISPDSRFIVATGLKPLVIDGATLERTPRFSNLSLGTSTKFSPNGSYLVSCRISDGGLDIRLNSTRDLQGPEVAVKGKILSMAFSPDSQFLATWTADGISIWDTLKGFCAVCEPIPSSGHMPSWSADANQMLVIADEYVEAWDVRRGSMLRTSSTMKFDDIYPRSLHPAPEHGKIVLLDAFGKALLADIRTGRRIGTSITHTKTMGIVQDKMQPTPPLWSQDGRWLLASPKDLQVVPCAADTGKPLRLPVTHSSISWHPVISPDSKRFVVATDDQTMRVCDTFGSRTTALACGSGRVTSVAFSPDSRTVYAAAVMDGIMRFDADTGRQTGDLGHKHTWITDLRALARHPYLLATAWNRVLVLDVENGKPAGKPLDHGGVVQSVIVSPDERLIYTAADDRLVRIWDADTLQPVGAPLELDAKPTHLVLTRDGRFLLALTEMDRVYIWDAVTGFSVQAPFNVPRGSHYLDLDTDTGLLTIAHQNEISTFNLGYLGAKNSAAYDQLRPLLLALAQKSLREDNRTVATPDAVVQLLRMRSATQGQATIPGWFMADRGTRGISPYDATPVPAWIEAQVESRVMDGLLELRELDHGNPRVMGRLAVELVGQTLYSRLAGQPVEMLDLMRQAARHLLDYLATRFPDDPEVRLRKRDMDEALRQNAEREAWLSGADTRREASVPKPTVRPNAAVPANPQHRIPPLRDTNQPPDPALLKAATDANATVPRMVDELTRLSRVEVYGKVMRYRMTLLTNLSDSAAADAWEGTMRRFLLEHARTNSYTVAMLGAGCQIEHYYEDSPGAFLFSVLVTADLTKVEEALRRLAYVLQWRNQLALPDKMKAFPNSTPQAVPEDSVGTALVADAFRSVNQVVQTATEAVKWDQIKDAYMLLATAALRLGMPETTGVVEGVVPTSKESIDVVGRLAESGRTAWGVSERNVRPR